MTNENDFSNNSVRSAGSAFNRICAYILVTACFLLSISVPVYWVFAKHPAFLELEKRIPAEWPTLSAENLLSGEFGEKVETWMADNMPLRSLLVGINSYNWYFSGRQFSRDVLMTSKGALVESPPAFDTAELKKRLDKISALSVSLDIPVTLVIPPNAGYIAAGGTGVLDGSQKSDLPSYIHAQYPDDIVADTVLLHSSYGGYTFTDLRQSFTESLAKEESLYYHTDHHWNAAGVYEAYKALGLPLGFTALPREAFSVSGKHGFYGSTYAKSGLWLTGPDSINIWSPPCKVLVTIGTGENKKTSESLFFTEHLKERDMYPVFLDGVYDTAIIDNLTAQDGDAKTTFVTEKNSKITPASGTLLIVQDSYANSLIPLLIPHYERIVAIDPRYYKKPASELARENGATAALVVYSTEHIVNDPDIVWLR